MKTFKHKNIFVLFTMLFAGLNVFSQNDVIKNIVISNVKKTMYLPETFNLKKFEILNVTKTYTDKQQILIDNFQSDSLYLIELNNELIKLNESLLNVKKINTDSIIAKDVEDSLLNLKEMCKYKLSLYLSNILEFENYCPSDKLIAINVDSLKILNEQLKFYCNKEKEILYNIGKSSRNYSPCLFIISPISLFFFISDGIASKKEHKKLTTCNENIFKLTTLIYNKEMELTQLAVETATEDFFNKKPKKILKSIQYSCFSNKYNIDEGGSSYKKVELDKKYKEFLDTNAFFIAKLNTLTDSIKEIIKLRVKVKIESNVNKKIDEIVNNIQEKNILINNISKKTITPNYKKIETEYYVRIVYLCKAPNGMGEIKSWCLDKTFTYCVVSKKLIPNEE